MQKIALLIPMILFSLLQLQSQDMGLIQVQDEGLYFIENKGQWQDGVQFIAKTKGLHLTLFDNNILFDYHRINQEEDEINRSGSIIKMQLKGSNNMRFEGIEKIPGYFNYFIGNDQSKWASYVNRFKAVKTRNAYEGIDFILMETNSLPRYDFVVHPGADPNQIQIKFDGIESVVLEGNSLIIKSGSRTIEHMGIFAYQEIDGEKVAINCTFNLTNEVVSFSIGEYDKTKQLVIDPTIFSTFWGGNGNDEIRSLKMDNSGNIVVAGFTNSYNFFYSTGAYDTTYKAQNDIFITKFKVVDVYRELMFSTLLGGTSDDVAYTVGLDQNNNVYVTGYTESSDFPRVVPFQSIYNGKKDAYVTKLNAVGSALIYSTYLGGKNDDIAYSMDVSAEGYAYITGGTYSSDFPMKAGDVMVYAGLEDLFLTKMDLSGSGIVFSTYFGNAGSIDRGTAVAASETGGFVIVANETNGAYGNYWLTAPVFDRIANGGMDAQIIKFPKNGGERRWYAFYGGMNDDRANSILIEPDGSFYIAGTTKSNISQINPPTNSNNFPITNGAYRSTYNSGESDGFFAKIEKDAKILYNSTYFGGNGIDVITGMVKHPINGNIVLTGYTNSSNFPLINPDGQSSISGGTDFFISEITTGGGSVPFSSIWGANRDDLAYGIAIDKDGSIYLAGTAYSDSWSHSTPIQSKFGGGNSDGFIMKYTRATMLMNNPRKDLSYCIGGNINIEWNWNDYPIGAKFNVFLYNELEDAWTELAKDQTASPFRWTVPNNLPAGKHYKVAVSNSNGQYVVTDGFFSLKAPPTIISASADKEDLKLCTGEDVSFTVLAEGEDLLYQWRRNGQNIQGKISNTLNLIDIKSSDAGSYDCIVRNGCAPDKTTTPFVLSLKYPPAITKQIENTEVEQSSNVLFEIAATGDNIRFEWYKDNIRLLGETTNKLTLANVQKGNEGVYKCRIIGDCGTIESNEARLTVTPQSSVIENLNSEFFKFNYLTVNNNSIKINLFTQFQCNSKISLISISGAIWQIKTVNLNESENYIDFNIENLATGTYWIVAECGKYNASSKFQVVR